MPKDPVPLSETEQFQLNRLLDKRSQTLPEAQAQRDRERDQERKLRARQDRLAAEEQRLARRLAALHVDLDVVSAEIFRIAPSGVSFRHVSEKLQAFGELIKTQSYFGTRFDTMDRAQIQLLAEIGLAMYQDSVRPKGGKTLRDRMGSVKVEVGPGSPDGPGDAADPRVALAQAIIAAGRKIGKTS